jgi:hypothetical protein
MATMKLSDYRRLLRPDKHRIDDGLEEQASLLDEISDARARANTAANLAKDELARIEAIVGDDLLELHGKLSVDNLKARVIRDSRRRDVFNAYQDAREAAEQWDGLYEAWKSRGFQLRGLADLWMASYFNSDSYTPREHERTARRPSERTATHVSTQRRNFR